MSPLQMEITPDQFSSHIPLFEKEADNIAAFIANLSVEELAERIGISQGLAAKAKVLYYDFHNKTTGYPALQAFTGEVFKAFEYGSLSKQQQAFASEKIGIISSLYGFLNPTSIIKPYRLDFSSSGSPSGEAMWRFWKKDLTIAFVKMLKAKGEKEIVDLLPSDASKCLDWKVIKAFAKVVKIEFKILGDNATLRTPHAGKLKELRGKFLRRIIEENINNLNSVMTLDSPDFAPAPELHRPGISLS
ncbi:MAG: YaaA family protein, partial [Muribaculaceae bacterium]|nr:YaaA family protein [Muribaculaceae bacterium]